MHRRTSLSRTGGTTYTFLTPPSLPIPPTPAQDRNEVYQTGTNWAVGYNGETFDAQQAAATLVSQYPGSFWSTGLINPGTAAVVAIYEALVTIGALAAITIGLLALIIATIDRALERRREIARITALGAPRTTLRRVHLLQTLPVGVIVRHRRDRVGARWILLPQVRRRRSRKRPHHNHRHTRRPRTARRHHSLTPRAHRTHCPHRPRIPPRRIAPSSAQPNQTDNVTATEPSTPRVIRPPGVGDDEAEVGLGQRDIAHFRWTCRY